MFNLKIYKKKTLILFILTTMPLYIRIVIKIAYILSFINVQFHIFFYLYSTYTTETSSFTCQVVKDGSFW